VLREIEASLPAIIAKACAAIPPVSRLAEAAAELDRQRLERRRRAR